MRNGSCGTRRRAALIAILSDRMRQDAARLRAGGPRGAARTE